MSEGPIQDFEFIATHIKDYIDDYKFFNVFEIDDIRQIMKYANLKSEDFISLLEQSRSAIKANDLYTCIRNAKVSILNYNEAISTLKSIQKYMKLNV
ncbi:hypothetical protein TVAG_080920 [Trichomonas vaginalis G3]|uniref:Uncharacterized protein n=1 Tax=Trichomonas vaginalis (strain ATCC PRA-98 / G3) TaxID=412133 RepID=A2EPB5_TRIV3|nr:ankyrin repeats (many copies)-containing protein [Trichomonas vaginalis G3]EAY05500.1 hypothetical protein TVAG_080920 [Trichomonas vaginalis G3]KAI5507803.1 ankyrin repeats (many copies)-containing protein [Trichomonas vaginalis G3]|eukprot:XP_001317723.1 hypothetical protein [Trichomonas vaginalis G3]